MSCPGKSYPSSTRALWGFMLVGGAVCAGLLAISRWGYRVVPVEMNEAGLRFLAFQLPLAVGLLLALILLAVGWFCSARSVSISSEGLVHVHHGQATVIPWDLMVVVRSGNGRMASALLSDGRRFVRIERALFPDFEEIMSALEERRKSRQASGKKMRM